MKNKLIPILIAIAYIFGIAAFAIPLLDGRLPPEQATANKVSITMASITMLCTLGLWLKQSSKKRHHRTRKTRLPLPLL